MNELLVCLAFYSPLALIWWMSMRLRFRQREWIGLLFSGTWLCASLPFLTFIGQALGYWTFTCSVVEQCMIMAIWVAWWLAFSLIPIGFNTRGYRYVHSILLALLAYGLDLIVMPMLSPWITMHPGWHAADGIVCLCLYTSLQLTRTTLRQEAHYKRNLFLGGTLLILTFWAPTALILQEVLILPTISFTLWSWLPLTGLVIGLMLAHQAAVDFARRGHGTPFPLDPPRYLVTSGAYRLVRNPMQTGFLIAGLSWWWLLGHWALATIPLSFLIYSVGFCHRNEEDDLAQRYGAPYRAYLAQTRNWIPTLSAPPRPHQQKRTRCRLISLPPFNGD